MAIRTTEAEWSRSFHKGRTEAEVPGIDEETFQEQAESTKINCPVSKALTGVEIGLEAGLTQRGRLNIGILVVALKSPHSGASTKSEKE